MLVQDTPEDHGLELSGSNGGGRVGPYDAVLLVSFGGPEAPDEVVPFLENVTRGRAIPRERLVEVGEHYFRFGGRSPINDQCRALLAAFEGELTRDGIDAPVYWGNRNWHPLLTDTLSRMRADGIRRAVCVFTSAYASYSGCRQYRENLAEARSGAGAETLRLDRVPQYFNRPGFVEPFVDGAVEALRELPAGSPLVFVTHAIPETMNEASGPAGGAYLAQHRDVAATVADRVRDRIGAPIAWDLAFCSRSGPPGQPWLEPDVNDHLRTVHDDGAPGVALVPIGFISDHMEVLFDLDTEAAATAEKLGLDLRRVPTPGTDARFVGLLRELVLERAALARGEQPSPVTYGRLGGAHAACRAGCCANPRGPVPAAAGEDNA